MSEPEGKAVLARIPVSFEAIAAERTSRGGFTAASLAKWGVPWPPPKGWQEFLIEEGAPYDLNFDETMRKARETWSMNERLKRLERIVSKNLQAKRLL